jgi:hypothetical protein
MRLLKCHSDGEFRLHDFHGSEIPPYAIVSHLRNEDDITFEDVGKVTDITKPGWQKLNFYNALITEHQLDYFWIDSCCVDRSSEAELTEMINSLFNWFQNARYCFAHLSDVENFSWEDSFWISKWFSRSWTLPALIAPKEIEFYSQNGRLLGNRKSLERNIQKITGIPSLALLGSYRLYSFNATTIFSWASRRSEEIPEDEAYALLSLFGVSMPAMYGEGKPQAFRRLQKQLVVSNVDADFQSFPGELYPTPVDESSFRLFVLYSGDVGSLLTGQIESHSISNPPVYTALSYVWGQEPPVHWITVNDGVVFIRPNLFHALQRIRPIGNEGSISLWVDSLCINQSDDVERTLQVQQMARIYQNAAKVAIWLGEADSTSHFAMNLVSDIESKNNVEERRELKRSWLKEHFGLIALGLILERPWFRRGWVLQEAAFSKSSTLYCGNRQIDMIAFVEAIREVRKFLETLDTTFLVDNSLNNFHDSPGVKLLDTVQDIFTKSDDNLILHHEMSLEALVELASFSDTTDQRDTIYALLNLANDVRPSVVTQITSKSLPKIVLDGKDEAQLQVSSAAEQAAMSKEDSKIPIPDTIIPDYSKDVLDVFTEFITHCCTKSKSLDIICRPWAPISSGLYMSQGLLLSGQLRRRECPSWIAKRENLAFGDPSEGSKHRIHGDVLVGSSRARIYNAHNDTNPNVTIEKRKESKEHGDEVSEGDSHSTDKENMDRRFNNNSKEGEEAENEEKNEEGKLQQVEGATSLSSLEPMESLSIYDVPAMVLPVTLNPRCHILHARGFSLGEISKTSTRMGGSIVTRECLDILGNIQYQRTSSPNSSERSKGIKVEMSDAIWRSLCAGRDEYGATAPAFYGTEIRQILTRVARLGPNDRYFTGTIDTEELIDVYSSELYKVIILTRIKNVVLNRRTFEINHRQSATSRTLVGLVPRKAEPGDQVCILYGCSVPVVLRRVDGGFWELVGEAYVDGFMDGEAFTLLGPAIHTTHEQTFEIH